MFWFYAYVIIGFIIALIYLDKKVGESLGGVLVAFLFWPVILIAAVVALIYKKKGR
jgi:uncharacterized membrane protein YhaH (DUF805 family)